MILFSITRCSADNAFITDTLSHRAILCAGGDSQLLHGKLHFEEVRPEAQQMQCKGILSQFPAGDIEHQASLGMHKHRSSSCQMEPGSRVGTPKLDPRILSFMSFFMDISSQLLQMYPVTVAMVRKKMKMWPKNVRTSFRTTINSWTKIGPTTPHLVLPIPDELEGLLKRLGVALP